MDETSTRRILYSMLKPNIFKSSIILIRDHVQKGDIKLEFVDTNHHVVVIFTKPLDKVKFEYFRSELGMIAS